MSKKKKALNRLHITQTEELKILRRIVDITCSDIALESVLKEVVEILRSKGL